MQTSVHDTLDLSVKLQSVHRLYGLEDDTTRSYAERGRLVPRPVAHDVRFVLILVNDQIWGTTRD